jgi:lipid-A-disaccharide synthase
MSEPARSAHIFIAAVEPSADSNGAALMRGLLAQNPDLKISGCGGEALEKAGLESLFPIDEFSVMGFTDVARVIPSAFNRAHEIAEYCRDQKVDVAVFVDGWAFSRISAIRIRKLSPQTKIIKYSAPQIWASRPQRIDFVRDHFDLVLALLPFEPPLFEAKGVKAIFVGNPNYEAVAKAKPDPGFRERHGLQGRKLLALLPGSRKGEVNRLMPVFSAVVEELCRQDEMITVIVPIAAAVDGLVREKMAAWSFPHLALDQKEKISALHNADAALTASGTAATELLLCDVPMVVAYKVDALTAFWARRVMITDYINILNIAEDREIIPEFVQERANVENIAPILAELLENGEAAKKQREAFHVYREQLGLDGVSAASRAANAVLSML